MGIIIDCFEWNIFDRNIFDQNSQLQNIMETKFSHLYTCNSQFLIFPPDQRRGLGSKYM